MKQGWKLNRIGELGVSVREQAKVTNGSVYELWSVPSFASGRPEMADSRSIGSAKLAIKPGDVLICKINPRINRVWIVREPTTRAPQIASTEWLVFRPNTNSELLPAWLAYFVSAPEFREWIVTEVSGATGSHTRIRADYILDKAIPLPPIAEQKRILVTLDKAFAAIATAKANTEKNLQNARAIFENKLDCVFSDRGHDWNEKTIGEVCTLRSGTTLSKKLERTSGEIPYLKVADMNIDDNLNGITSSSRYVNKIDVNRSNLLPVGTTIFPKRGGAILTNKKRLTKRIICADLNIMGVTPRSGLLPEFLFSYFLRLDLCEINNGSSIPQINNYSIEPLPIAFPNSVEEQRAIVSGLESLSNQIQHLESTYRQKLAALGELKECLLHQALSGQL